jgi:hypothetical protein
VASSLHAKLWVSLAGLPIGGGLSGFSMVDVFPADWLRRQVSMGDIHEGMNQGIP